MKTKKLVLSAVLLIFIFTKGFSQQIGNGVTTLIDNFNAALPSGMYKTNKIHSNYPSEVTAWPMKHLINVGDNNNIFQISSPYTHDDRMLFRKVVKNATNPNCDNEWFEVATRHRNIFTGDQIIASKNLTSTESSKLFFGNENNNGEGVYFMRYNPAANHSTLFLILGNKRNGGGRFMVGNHEGGWKSFISIVNNGRVGIGGIDNPQHTLEVNGTIRAKEVRVESGWADFVFDADYKLPALNEVKAHIEEHRHLPGMPSAAEVQENGVGLSEATTLLLQKVEELTLYIIQQNEEIESLKVQIQINN